MVYKKIISIVLVVFIAACSTSKPNFIIATHDPLLDNNNGPALIVDVCIKADVIGDDDYFVVEEAKTGARELIKNSKECLNCYGIESDLELIPFVCGTLHDVETSPKNFAGKIGAQVEKGHQPFACIDRIKSDDEYLEALKKSVTFVFQKSLQNAQTKLDKKKFKLNSKNNSSIFISEEDFKAATAIIAERTNKETAIIMGIMGNKLSKGKSLTTGALKFSVGIATGLATYGTLPSFAAGATTYQPYIISFPVGDKDQWQMYGGFLNLKSGEVLWTNVAFGYNDPIETKAFSKTQNLEWFFKDLVVKPSKEWVPPGYCKK